MALRRDISLALAVDEDAAVRKRIAANDATPDSALFELAESDFWEVRFSALKNPSFPADRRDQSMGKLAQEIRDALEPGPSIGPDDFNPEDFSLPLEVLELLPPKEDRKAIAKAAKSRDWLQRAATTLCEGVTVGELRRLLDDEVEVLILLAVVRREAGQIM